MTFSHRKIIALICIGALTCAFTICRTHSAAAQPEITQRAEWTYSSSESVRHSAALAVPETDNVWIVLSCEASGGPVLVTIEPFVVLEFPPATTPAARFVVDGREFIRGLRMTGYDEMREGYLFEVVVDATDPLLRAMQEGRSLTATTHPNEGTDPPENTALVGSKSAIEELLEACSTRRH